MDYSATSGIISHVRRPIPSGNYPGVYLQVDAPLYMGSSGGPIFNLQKELIGIVSRGGADSTVGLAVPVGVISQFLKDISPDMLKLSEKDDTGCLPFHFQLIDKPFKNALSVEGVEGILISGYLSKSALSFEGIKLGDILMTLSGAPLIAQNNADLERLALLFNRLPRVPLKFSILRGDKELVNHVTPAERHKCNLPSSSNEHAWLQQKFLPPEALKAMSSSLSVVTPPIFQINGSQLKVGDIILGSGTDLASIEWTNDNAIPEDHKFVWLLRNGATQFAISKSN